MKLTCMKFSRSHSLVRVPDISGIPNLRELDLDDCPNLLEIDYSVGCLNKLVNLSARRCTKLKTFPHSIKSTSLEGLELGGCSMLKRFPDMSSVKTNKYLHIDISGSGIEELPSSIENLTGPLVINVSDCQSLTHIPVLRRGDSLPYLIVHALRCPQLGKSYKNSLQIMQSTLCTDHSTEVLQLRHMPELCGCASSVSVTASRCPQLVKSCKNSLQIMQSTLCTDHSTASSNAPNDILPSPEGPLDYTLSFNQCDVSDKTLPSILSYCAYVTFLDLSGNNFKLLPECIINLSYLESLWLNDCTELQRISVIPPKLRIIGADNCTSLTLQSQNFLLDQVKTKNLEITMPFSRFPEWFDHISRDAHISFRFRNKFPDIVMGYINENAEYEAALRSTFLINGHQIIASDLNISHIKEGHLWVFDLRGHLDHWTSLDSYVVDEWNDVQISFTSKPVFYSWMSLDSDIKCGIYINNKETKIEDILFGDPYPPQDSGATTSDYDDSGATTSDSDVCSSEELDGEGNPDLTIVSAEPMNEIHIFKRSYQDSSNFEEDMGSFHYPLPEKQCVDSDNDGRVADINGHKDSGQQLLESGKSLGGNNSKDLFTCTGVEDQCRESPSLCLPTECEGNWDPMELEYNAWK